MSIVTTRNPRAGVSLPSTVTLNAMDKLVESVANSRFGDFVASVLVSLTVLSMVCFFVYYHMNVMAFVTLSLVVAVIGVLGIKRGVALGGVVYGFDIDRFDTLDQHWSEDDSSLDSDSSSSYDYLVDNDDFDVEE